MLNVFQSVGRTMFLDLWDVAHVACTAFAFNLVTLATKTDLMKTRLSELQSTQERQQCVAL